MRVPQPRHSWSVRNKRWIPKRALLEEADIVRNPLRELEEVVNKFVMAWSRENFTHEPMDLVLDQKTER